MFACGVNDRGQLGLGDTTHPNTFTAVPPLPDGKVAKQVVAGSNHTTILAEDGTVFLFVVLPRPSCPMSFLPQANMADENEESPLRRLA